MDKLTSRLTRKEIEGKDITTEDLKLVLRTYSKAANTRLRALEKANLTSAPAYVKIKNYARDKRDFMALDKRGRFKFNTNTRRMDREAVQEELIQLHTFLFESKTSTVSGAKERKRKQRESQKRYRKGKSKRWSKYFENMSESEYDKFFTYSNLKKVHEAFDSDTVIRLIESSEQNPFIAGDPKLLDLALEPIIDSINDMSEMALFRYVWHYRPTGSVT